MLPASWRFPWRPRTSERELARQPGSGDAGLHSASRPSLCAPSPLEGGEPWPAEPRGLRGRPIELGTRGPSPELGIRDPSPSGGPGLAGHGGGAGGAMDLAVSGPRGGIGGLLFFLFGIRSHVVGFAAAGKRRPRSLLLPPRDEDPPCTPVLATGVTGRLAVENIPESPCAASRHSCAQSCPRLTRRWWWASQNHGAQGPRVTRAASSCPCRWRVC